MTHGTPPESGSNLPAEFTPQAVAQPQGRRGVPSFGAGGEDVVETVSIARYIDAIKRQLWLIMLVAIVGTAAGFYVVSRVAPVYEAEATIWINAPTQASAQSALGGEPVFRGQNSWNFLIRAPAVTDPVVRALGLYLFASPLDSAIFRSFTTRDTTFQAGRFHLQVDTLGHTYTLTQVGSLRPPETGAVGDSIGLGLGFVWVPDAQSLPPKRTADFVVATIHTASNVLESRLRTSLPEQAQFMKLYLTGTDPHKTAATLNALAQQFVSTANDLKRGYLVDSRQGVGTQLATVTAQLKEDERKLQEFREKTILLQPDNAATLTPAGVTGYLALQAQLDALQKSREALERVVTETGGGAMRPDPFYTIPGILTDWPLLKKQVDQLVDTQEKVKNALRFKGPEDREVVSLLAEQRAIERETLPATTNEIIGILKKREQDIGARLEVQRGELQEIPRRSIEEQRLTNNRAASLVLFNSLQARNEQLRLVDVETAPDLKFFDQAQVPTLPKSDRGPKLLLMAALASLAAGLALALLRDRVDRRFRYPEQATIDLGLAIVGTVPNLRINRRGELSVADASQLVESFRTLRLAVRYHFGQDQPVVLCVSSSGPAEGKSFVSANLAVAFANGGQRTLLIDGDVRRGVVHTTFGLDRRPGLVDYLAGHVQSPDVVRTTSTNNLSVIPSGSRNRKAPEYLGSERMAKLMIDMRARFEVVIVDTPPFAAGMDAYALAAAAGAMVVVLRPGHTDRKLMEAKLEILDRLPVAVLGAVINGISTGAGYRYYNYDSQYASDVEVDEDADFAGASTTSPSPPRLVKPK